MNRLLVLSTIVLGLLSCNKDCELPTEPTNSPPVIQEIIKDLSEVPTDRWVTVTAIATDKDGDPLSYFWSATAGRTDTYSNTDCKSSKSPGGVKSFS